MAVLASTELASELADLNETRKAVENAENRARLEQRKSDSRIGRRNNREYAQALHREADKLYRSGDYETALVLYHRAANLFPRDSSHSVAARRTAATISSCNNPSKALRKALPGMNNGERLTMSLCPETAAMLANDRLKKSPDPSSVAQILSYFDTHKRLWKTLPSPRPSNTQLARSKTTLNNRRLADMSLTNLEATFKAGKMTAALKIAQELLLMSAGFHDPSRYQIAAYHYLSLIHVALERHDRAVCAVSRLVRLSKSTENVVLIYRSLVTLGKVHLSFGHLNAAAKSWEHLAKDLKEPIPLAWIRHEIGRCHLETGKYQQAAEMAVKCVDAAVTGKSKKWLLYGKLLLGVSMAKLGRFVDAVEELQVAAKITEEEGDTPMLSYIRDLIDQVAHVLRSISYENKCFQQSTTAETQKRPGGVFVSREETVITTMFTKRMITEYHDGSSSEVSVDVDEELTMHSARTGSRERPRGESGERSSKEEQPEELTSRGDATFRRTEPSQEQGRPASPSPPASTSSSSSHSSTEKLDQDEETEEAEEEWESDRADNDVQPEDGPKCASSKTSFKSVNTTATYVIEGGDSIAETKADSDHRKEIMELIDKVAADDDSRNDKDTSNAILGDRYVHVIEQLEKMEDMELLMLLKEKLQDQDWSTDLGNAGDTRRESARTPRSRQDNKSGVLANH